jgi:hypothetical protein
LGDSQPPIYANKNLLRSSHSVYQSVIFPVISHLEKINKNTLRFRKLGILWFYDKINFFFREQGLLILKLWNAIHNCLADSRRNFNGFCMQSCPRIIKYFNDSRKTHVSNFKIVLWPNEILHQSSGIIKFNDRYLNIFLKTETCNEFWIF